MGKVLVYWIEITDHGRCDDPRDHIWHALHRYHSLDLSLIKIKSRKCSIILSTSKCILASQACCHFYDMLVLLLAILCAKSLHCHLHLYCNTLFSFYIIFTFSLVGYGRVTGDSAVTRPRVPEEAFSGSCLLQLDPLQMRGYEQQQNLQNKICSIV